jgi:predicted dinucleotide-binding enzyme
MDTSQTKGGGKTSRREFLAAAAGAAAGLALAPGLSREHFGLSAMPLGSMRIGIIGAGRIGAAVGIEWAKAGHEIFFSSRNPDELAPLVQQAGPRARAGLPPDAAAFGQVVVIGTPYDALPQVGRDYATQMRGKPVVVFSNQARQNGGAASQDAISRGWGVVTPELLPGTRVTRAFNAINFRAVTAEAHRAGEKVGIPIAGDDVDAVRITSELVVDAGFDPLVVGGLDRASLFDPGTPVFVTNMTAAQLREALGLR